MVVRNETSLTSNALWSMLGPVLVALFIWEEPGLPLILQELGLPHRPWIRELWAWSWPAEPFPAYAVNFTDIFGLIAIVGGFLKFWIDDELIEETGLQSGQKVFTTGDRGSMLLITVLSIAAAALIGYPMEPVPIAHGLLIILLYTVFSGIVSSTRWFLGLPATTYRFSVKVLAFAFILGACVTATGLIVVVMQYLHYVF